MGSHIARQRWGRTPRTPSSGLYLPTPSRCEGSDHEMASEEVALNLASVTLKQGGPRDPLLNSVQPRGTGDDCGERKGLGDGCVFAENAVKFPSLTGFLRPQSCHF